MIESERTANHHQISEVLVHHVPSPVHGGAPRRSWRQEVAKEQIARPEPKLLRWRMLTFLRELREAVTFEFQGTVGSVGHRWVEDFPIFWGDGMDQNHAKPKILADFPFWRGCISIIGDFGVKKRVPGFWPIVIWIDGMRIQRFLRIVVFHYQGLTHSFVSVAYGIMLRI